MEFSFLGVRTFLVCVAAVLAGTAGSAQAAFAPQPTPVAVGIDSGGGPWLTAFSAPGCMEGLSTYAGGCWLTGWLAEYDFTSGGLHAAVGDVTGDGHPDIVTVPGIGARADVRVFDGSGTVEQSGLYAGPNWGGRAVALGDVNGDGRFDYVLGNDAAGGPTVQVLDGRTGKQLAIFSTFNDPQGQDGIRVAAADVNGDGRAEIVTANGPGQEPRVSVYPGVATCCSPAPLRTFLAFDSTVSSGLHVAAGDLNGDGRAEIAAIASSGQGPELRVFDGATGNLVTDVFPFSWAAPDSLRVAIGDATGDGTPDLVVAGDTANGPQIEVISASGAPRFKLPGVSAGESVAVGDVTGDDKPDLVVTDGPGADPRVTVFAANGSLESSFSAYGPSFTNGVRVAAGDFDGNGGTEYVAGQGPGGSSRVDLLDGSGASLLTVHPFAGSASDGVYVAAADANGDRHADIVVGADAGGEPRASVYDRTGRLLSSFLAFEPSFTGGVRVAAGDLDGDGRAEIVVGSGPGRPAEVRVFSLSGTLLRRIVPFDPFFSGGVYPAVGDLNGDGQAEIAVGAGAGGDGVVRTFDAAGGALARFQPYGGTSNEVRVAIGDVTGTGTNDIVTTSGREAPASVDVFAADGTPIGSFSANPDWRGGLYVGVQGPLGRPLTVATPAVAGVEGDRVSLRLPVTDPDGVDSADDLAGTILWGDGRTSGVLVVRPTVLLAGHSYRAAGTYTVVDRVVDRLHRTRIVSGLATVRDAPLNGHGLTNRYSSSQRHAGIVATFRDANRFARPRDFNALVSFRNGPSTDATVQRVGPGRFVVRASLHLSRGRHVALVRVDDEGGSQARMRTVIKIGP